MAYQGHTAGKFWNTPPHGEPEEARQQHGVDPSSRGRWPRSKSCCFYLIPTVRPVPWPVWASSLENGSESRGLGGLDELKLPHMTAQSASARAYLLAPPAPRLTGSRGDLSPGRAVSSLSGPSLILPSLTLLPQGLALIQFIPFHEVVASLLPVVAW